ncbi:hypothetical protein V1L54_19255 [Streptomyces sp. TRM 70361]|nr:hypothetical protein [Streptomyces sp. TRM 70361]MEE1941519.1 hypothetical protein [Streptomyces sp. TRM 70361]
MTWRTGADSDVPGWLLALPLGLASAVPVLVAAVRDRRDRRGHGRRG